MERNDLIIGIMKEMGAKEYPQSYQYCVEYADSDTEIGYNTRYTDEIVLKHHATETWRSIESESIESTHDLKDAYNDFVLFLKGKF